MSRVLVSGAAGFVGANLVRRLAEDGHEVTALVRPGSDRWRLDGLSEAIRIVEADLRDTNSTGHAVRAAHPERVFHLAAWGGYSWQTDPARIAETLVSGTVNLLNACIETGADSFVNTGSSSEYGYQDHAPEESETPVPNSPYATAKVAATVHCRQAAGAARTRIVTLRPYSAYGPWEEPNRLVPTLIVKGIRGELPPLVNPDVARDFLWIGDLVEAYLLAAEREPHEPGAVYNVATGVQTTIRQAVEVARAEFAIKAEPQWGSMPDRSWDTTCWIGNPGLIERTLGWAPTVEFADGFHRTAAWLRSNPALLDSYSFRQSKPG
ncbi:MAG: NAD-dependent epimerase/dehydratase family protein [Candidatus Coatesbacteria bacterium]